MPPGGLWRAWGAAPEPQGVAKKHPENANWPKKTPKRYAGDPKSPKEPARLRISGDPPTVRKGPQETSQRVSEAKITQTSKMTIASIENLDFGGPKGQKLKGNARGPWRLKIRAKALITLI